MTLRALTMLARQRGEVIEGVATEASMKSRGSNWLSSRYGLVIAGLALIAGLLAFDYKFKLVVVAGQSMLPTLRTGDLLVVDRRAYEKKQPVKGDVVVGRYHKSLIVKRIVGLPGEVVEVRKGRVFADGVANMENYPVEPGRLDIAKGKLFEGDFALLGDNRSIPAVLAVHPVLSTSELIGKVVFSTSPVWLVRRH
jgi:signal peptidase I